MLDAAEVHDRIGRYVAPGEPRWSAQYVRRDGKAVLVVTVESPREGDPIFTLQRTFERWSEGRIFVRRHGKTEEANPADIRALEARAGGSRPKVSLVVRRGDEGVLLRTLRVTGSARDDWLAAERSRLLSPLTPTSRPRPSSLDPFSFPQISSARSGLISGDMRSENEFRQDVEAYLASASNRWTATAAALAIKQELAPLRLQIVNPTERNFDEVEVVLDVDGEAGLWLSPRDPFELVSPPDPPEPWGSRTIFGPIRTVPRLHLPWAESVQDEIEREGPIQRVRFGSRHVRPEAVLSLPPVFLTLPVDRAGGKVDARWHLTSTSVDGSQSGDLTYEVEETPSDIMVPAGDVDVLDD